MTTARELLQDNPPSFKEVLKGIAPASDLKKRLQDYKDSCKKRVQCCEPRIVGPAEEMQWMESPLVGKVVFAPATWEMIVPADPQRIAVIFSLTNSVGVAFMVPSPNEPTLIAGADGLGLWTTGQPRLEITQAVHGSLCQSAWWGSSNGPGTIAFVSVSLKQWPEGK